MVFRKYLVDKALDDARKRSIHSEYQRAFEALRSSRVYVWERPAMEAFWTFWEDSRNYSHFMDKFFTHEGLIYRSDMITREFHMFPAPGRLLANDLQPERYKDPTLSLIFPPTTLAIGITGCELEGKKRLSAVIESIQANPNLRDPLTGKDRIDKITVLPKEGPNVRRLMQHVETRYLTIENGIVADNGGKPINWLMTLYQLQIFLLQPFVGHMRKVSRGQSKKKMTPLPPQEIVQVLMREPLPVRIPRYVVASVHPVTGKTLEFEVDVRAHERHLASGVVTTVRAHKRGPIGKSREKVIKVIR